MRLISLASTIVILFFSVGDAYGLINQRTNTAIMVEAKQQGIQRRSSRLANMVSATAEFGEERSSRAPGFFQQVIKPETFKIMFQKMEITIYLTLWFAISAVYNIYNKKALNSLSMPWFVATVQMGMGIPIFVPLWILKLRNPPADTASDWKFLLKSLSKVALFQTLTHISGVVALGLGAVSFTQIVKASEPVFTAALSAVFLKQFLPWQVWCTFLPICAGVAVASTSELSFTWACLWAGVIANVFAAARGVYGKLQMCGDTKCYEELSPENYYAILTLLSFGLLIPCALMVEGPAIAKALTVTMAHLGGSPLAGGSSAVVVEGMRHTVISGVLFYLYNEVSFRALDKLHPVSHAVANTVKRIVIILSSVIVFKNQITTTGMVGSVVAILGVFLYSIAGHMFKQTKKDKKET